MVVGKAISVTHDAFPSIRMQADLENLGGITRIIAFNKLGCILSEKNIFISIFTKLGFSVNATVDQEDIAISGFSRRFTFCTDRAEKSYCRVRISSCPI